MIRKITIRDRAKAGQAITLTAGIMKRGRWLEAAAAAEAIAEAHPHWVIKLKADKRGNGKGRGR